MLEITKKKFIFKIKEIWFADRPFEVKSCHSVWFRRCKNKIDVPGFQRKEFSTLVIDLKQDLETIWQNMDKSSCRYAIKRAERDGVEIKINQNYQEFYQINREFRKSKNLSIGISGSLEFIKKYGTLFTAVFQDEVVAGCIFLEDEDNIRWLLGASKRLEVLDKPPTSFGTKVVGGKEKASLIGNANRLIIWEAIKYAKAKGIKEFDFGGYYTGEKKDEEKERINVFKKSFGGELTVHYIYRKDYSKLFHFLKKIFLAIS